MPRKTRAEEHMIIQKLKDGVIPEQVQNEHNLTRTQLNRFYQKAQGTYQAPPPRPKKKTIENEERRVEQVHKEPVTPEPVVEKTQEENDDLSLSELGVVPETPTATNEIDPSKDYCGNCYAKGTLTEIQKEMKMCPVCAGVLEWEQ